MRSVPAVVLEAVDADVPAWVDAADVDADDDVLEDELAFELEPPHAVMSMTMPTITATMGLLLTMVRAGCDWASDEGSREMRMLSSDGSSPPVWRRPPCLLPPL